jgi:cytoskeletal protein RodZ
MDFHDDFPMDSGIDFFNLFPIFFTIIFVIIIGVFIIGTVKGFSQWRKNENSPRLSVAATVTSKRTDVSHYHHSNDHHGHSSTSYYATFEFESGDRQEFHLSANDYSQLAEQDKGTLTFQGSRYLGFEREITKENY